MPDETRPEDLSKSREANWPAVLFFIHVHLLAAYGLWMLVFEVKWMTALLLVILTSAAVLGVTAGAHRLWAHRSYKASTGLRIALMLCQTLAGQVFRGAILLRFDGSNVFRGAMLLRFDGSNGPIYEWVQHHRLHHAQFGTDGDPYDYNKGFLYVHVTTRLRRLSHYQEHLKDQVDMSDLEDDPVVMVQNKLYWVLYTIIFLLLPLNAPLEYWDDSVLSAVFVIGLLRYGIVLHASWLVESALCLWGLRPGEKCPPDSNSVFLLSMSFWPHYHYLFPYDYKSGEYGTYDSGCATSFIRVWAALGLATDLKTIDTPTVQRALADAARSKNPVKTCLEEAVTKLVLSNDHYLRRG